MPAIPGHSLQSRLRRHPWRTLAFAVAAIVVVCSLEFVLLPITVHQQAGWTGLLVLGDQTGDPPSCPLKVTDDRGKTFAGHLIHEADGEWTRFDLPPGHYRLDGFNVDEKEATILPFSHAIINQVSLVGCISHGLDTN